MKTPSLRARLLTRRNLLATFGCGLGGLAAVSLFRQFNTQVPETPPNLPTAPPAEDGAKRYTAYQRNPESKSVILLFMSGGQSQMDLYDPKPTLERFHGRPVSGELDIEMPNMGNSGLAFASPFKFSRHGQTGVELSELVPNLGTVADDITLIRSMQTTHNQHLQAVRFLHCGSVLGGRPTMGSWASYGLGQVNDNLPMYVVLPGKSIPVGGPFNWSSSWLPKENQGVVFNTNQGGVVDLNSFDRVPIERQSRKLDLLHDLNQLHLQEHPDFKEFESRISSFELAARMQFAVPDCTDLSDETKNTRAMYGLDQTETADFGTRCLQARRLVERGVRFVHVLSDNQVWDNHTDLPSGLKKNCKIVDLPIAGLIKDLKQRGLLESTIVVVAGEFGRLPTAQDLNGRDHNPHAFTIVMAGGGVKQGYVHGETDELGYRSIGDPVSMSDFHATLLHLLGLSHQELTFFAEGRDQRLTDVNEARVVQEILA